MITIIHNSAIINNALDLKDLIESGAINSLDNVIKINKLTQDVTFCKLKNATKSIESLNKLINQ